MARAARATRANRSRTCAAAARSWCVGPCVGIGHVVVRLDVGHEVRRAGVHEPDDREARAAVDHEVAAPVGERLDVAHLGNAPDAAARRGRGVRAARRDEAEAAVGGLHVGEHAAVARLEDVQRLRRAREEHERQREEREPAHAFTRRR
jgi:hypothetical protein